MHVVEKCMREIPDDIVIKAFNHTHHKVSNTGNHSIIVALTAMKIGKFLGLKKNSLYQLVQAAVWHDVGIINTYDVYSNWFERNRRHPERSCLFYRKYVKDYDDKVCSMIATHMWPFNFKNIPKSKEAWILDIADDIASIKDRFGLESKYELCVIAEIKYSYIHEVYK